MLGPILDQRVEYRGQLSDWVAESEGLNVNDLTRLIGRHRQRKRRTFAWLDDDLPQHFVPL